MKKFLRITLGSLLAVIALNAFGGGYYGMAGAENVPVEWLNDSPFKSYFLPSLFLFIVVGGTCLAGSVAAFKGSRYFRQLAFVCGALLIAWIGAQVSVIGYVSWMQPAIFISAIVIILIAYALPKNKNVHVS